jgi:hypothetical protein
MISRNPLQRPDASSISVWVKNHLRNVDSLRSEPEEQRPTHRSNSSPARISSKMSLLEEVEDQQQRPLFRKSHSFTAP